MKRYQFVTCALVCVALMATMAFAADMSLGTWKLNLAKSKYDPANLAPKSQTVKNEAAPDGVKQVGRYSRFRREVRENGIHGEI